jgi:hypothetical protein
MQDRRYRPGDVLDDYCPRERRITDHAIVAMVDETIQRTRCGSCDAEHEFKEAKVPAPRRKTQPPALFTQVLDGLQGSTPRPQSPPPASLPALDDVPAAAAVMAAPIAAPPPISAIPLVAPAPIAAVAVNGDAPAETDDERERDGGFRRSLIRATFPKLEGQTPEPRALPDFTIQSLNNRGRNNNGGAQRHAGGGGKFRGRRRAGGGSQDNLGPMRFREHGSGPGQQGQNQGQGQGQGQGGGRRRRGGKKNR